MVKCCLRLRPGADLSCPADAARYALRQLTRRIHMLTEEIDEVSDHLTTLTASAGPDLVALFGVVNETASETAGQLLVTGGDTSERLRTEAAFATLCGAAPVPGSSGRADRHRLTGPAPPASYGRGRPSPYAPARPTRCSGTST
uniref:transposase n=2 Tax=Streptomyces poriferorum TaxID=2798799 RepID=UPI0035325363